MILVHLMLNLLFGSLVSLKELYVNFYLMNWLKVLISISQDVEDEKQMANVWQRTRDLGVYSY